MIRTHKPRGWSNASTFQQTEEFRDINFDECTAPPAKVYCTGSDEKRPATERAAKRRRIEKLADNFLNGEPLHISSVRPCPEVQRRTIVWNKKSSDEPKFVLPEINHPAEPADDWEDVEDEAEILKRAIGSRSKSEGALLGDCEEPGSIEEEATASCGRRRRARSFQVAIGPSEDALRIAAMLRLRAKQLERVVHSDCRPGGEADYDTPPDGVTHHALSEPATLDSSSDWLSRRKSNAFGMDIIDASLDELRLSRLETPSRPLQRLGETPTTSPRTHEMALRQRTTRQREREEVETPAFADRWRDQRQVCLILGGSNSKEYGTGTLDHDYAAGLEQNVQPEATTYRGNMLPPTSSSKTVLPPTASLVDQTRNTPFGAPGPQVGSQSAPARQTRSAMPLVTPIQPALQPSTTGPHHYSPHVYPAVETAQNGSTPFMFRRRGSGFDTGPFNEGEVQQVRRSKRLRSTSTGPTPSGPVGEVQKESNVVVLRRPMKFTSQPMSSPMKKPTRVLSGISTADTPRCTSEPPTVQKSADDSSLADLDSPRKDRRITQFWPGTQVLLYEAQQDLFRSLVKQAVADENAHASHLEEGDATPAQAPTRAPLKELSQTPFQSTQAMLAAFPGFSTVKKPRGGYIDSPGLTPSGEMKAYSTHRNHDSPTTSLGTRSSLLASRRSERQESRLRHSITSTATPVKATPPIENSRVLDLTIRPTMNASSTDTATQASMPSSRSNLRSSTNVADKPTPASLPVTRQRNSFRSDEGSPTEESLPANPLAFRSRVAPAATESQQSSSHWEASSFHPVVDECLSSFQAAQRQSSSMSESQLNRTIDDLDATVLGMEDGLLSQE